jgi:hypothetical protein
VDLLTPLPDSFTELVAQPTPASAAALMLNKANPECFTQLTSRPEFAALMLNKTKQGD